MDGWLQCQFSDDDIEIIEPTVTFQGSQAAARKRRNVLKAAKTAGEGARYSADDLWLNKYKPLSVAQVVGNKAKIVQLREWIKETTSRNNSNKILLVTGPSGCGKTAAVETIAAELNISLKHWTSQIADFSEQRGDNYINYESQSALFEGFLLRAAKYTALPLCYADTSCCTQQIVLVEDIPNVYLKSPNDWHQMLRAFIKSSRSPLVIIYNTSGSVTERLMFPESLQNQLNIKHFAFNAVPKTDIRRLLSAISDNERQLNIPKDFIARLSESCDGDIRIAVNTLQFQFSVPQERSQLPSKSRVRSASPPARRKVRKTTSTKETCSQDGDVTEVVYKDPTLVIFRALGKVLHCKRLGTQSDDERLLPAHLRHHVRCEMAFSPEQAFEQAQVSADYYTLCLHQNYPQFLSNLENATRAVDYLSHSDCLSQRFSGRTVTGQATAGVSTAARGLMHASTTISSSSHKLGWVPLHKPQWFSANKQLRENQVNVKWQNNSLYSSAVIAQDLLPALHMMQAKTTLTQLIPPLLLATTHQYSRQDRLDDKHGRDDIILDMTLDAEQWRASSTEETVEELVADDPEEYRIEPFD